MTDDDPVVISDEVAEAMFDGTGVVALETTLVSHGFPNPEGVEVALAAEAAVRAVGAVPATVGIVDGVAHVGLAIDQIRRFGDEAAMVHKLGPRDIGARIALGGLGATTVGATLMLCQAAGITVMATGGIGGVHRGYPAPPDVSADLWALARLEPLVVCAGVKSILDVAATAEMLETMSVPVIGWRTATMPLFYTAAGGPPVSARADDVGQVAKIAQAHWGLGGAGLLLVRPPDTSIDVEPLIAAALAEATGRGVAGQDVTPFVLGRLHQVSGGATLRANRELIVANAGLAGEVAVALALDELVEDLVGDEWDVDGADDDSGPLAGPVQ